MEAVGLPSYEAAGGAAWLETSHAALIVWEWTEKPVGAVRWGKNK